MTRPALNFNIDWDAWQEMILKNGITVDRPYGSRHPSFPEIVYPIDYGFVNNTTGTDGDEVDVFVGMTRNGLVGAILTHDRRKGDREVKLIYNCAPPEIYLVNGFINFDPNLMTGDLVLRQPMADLYEND